MNSGGDAQEREADRAAEQVMRAPETQQQRTSVQEGRPRRQEGQGEKGDAQAEPIRTHGVKETPSPHAAHEAFGTPGQPLDSATRGFMESRFGEDFSRVRVHTDERAAESARSLEARAYTLGHDVVFAAHQYEPATTRGKSLLAHELSHVVQQRQGGPRVQRQRDFEIATPEPVVVSTSGDETTLALSGLLASHRVRLRVEEPTLRGRQAFAWQFVPGEPTLQGHATLRIVAAPGVSVRPEGWPAGWHVAGPQHPALEIYRVQDPALVPPQGEPIIPSRYVGERASPAADERRSLLSAPPFVVRSTVSSVDIIHVQTNVTVHIEVRNLAAADRFAYELVEGDLLTGRGTEVRVVKTVSTPLLVRAGAGVLPISVRVSVVDRLSEVPPQGRPLAGVGRELSSVPAQVQLTAEQQLACAVIPAAISMIPIVGEIYMIADFAYGLSTGRDPLCGQRRDELGHMMAGLGALLGVVSLGLRGVVMLTQATGRTTEAASALAAATRELSPADREAILRLKAAVERGETLSAADSQLLARILRQLEARVAQAGGRNVQLGGLLNAERTGFVEPELQQAYQRYLAGAGERPLAPEAWVSTPEGEGAFRSVFGEAALGRETAGGPAGGARARLPGRPYRESPHPHVRQRTDIWCGAACGEMAARRLGVEVSQAQLAATPHFQPRAVVGHVITEGGFQTEGLAAALRQLAPVPGRNWVGGTIIGRPVGTPAELATTLAGFLHSTESSIILRVRGTRHWIVVDEVLADGRIVIRDPGHRAARVLTADELFAYHPSGDVVLSFPQPTGGAR